MPWLEYFHVDLGFSALFDSVISLTVFELVVVTFISTLVHTFTVCSTELREEIPTWLFADMSIARTELAPAAAGFDQVC